MSMPSVRSVITRAITDRVCMERLTIDCDAIPGRLVLNDVDDAAPDRLFVCLMLAIAIVLARCDH